MSPKVPVLRPVFAEHSRTEHDTSSVDLTAVVAQQPQSYKAVLTYRCMHYKTLATKDRWRVRKLERRKGLLSENSTLSASNIGVAGIIISTRGDGTDNWKPRNSHHEQSPGLGTFLQQLPSAYRPQENCAMQTNQQ
jgi:hypothetical protein